MHWRGDRVSGQFGTDMRIAPPFDSQLAFKNFIVAFKALLGRADPIADEDMQSFSDFALRIVLPPNPVRALDNTLDLTQALGKRFFMGCEGLDSSTGMPVVCASERPTGTGHLADGAPGFGFTCQGCHVLDAALGFFGTDGQSSFENLPQIMKVPHLRNLYTKVGMFGLAPSSNMTGPGDPATLGPQVRGFGFENDGAVDTLFHFLQAGVFTGSVSSGFASDDQRRAVEQYLLAFDTDLAPIVGQQVTLRSDNAASAGPRIDLLIERASTPFVSKILGPNATECQLVANGVKDGHAARYRLGADGKFAPEGGGGAVSDADLRASAATPGQEITYTCLPPGWADRWGR
jgi:hypothetical protein